MVAQTAQNKNFATKNIFGSCVYRSYRDMEKEEKN